MHSNEHFDFVSFFACDMRFFFQQLSRISCYLHLHGRTMQVTNRHDGVVVRASASQSVDLEFISLAESYQKTLTLLWCYGSL